MAAFFVIAVFFCGAKKTPSPLGIRGRGFQVRLSGMDQISGAGVAGRATGAAFFLRTAGLRLATFFTAFFAVAFLAVAFLATLRTAFLAPAF